MMADDAWVKVRARWDETWDRAGLWRAGGAWGREIALCQHSGVCELRLLSKQSGLSTAKTNMD